MDYGSSKRKKMAKRVKIALSELLLLTFFVLGSFFGLAEAYFGAAAAKSLQSCLTLCNPIGSSPPGPAVPGILQARTLEWVSISSSNA